MEYTFQIVDWTYAYYRKLWKDDRWKFSGDMVRMTIKSNREGLAAEEQHKLDVMNRIVDEHDGNWMEDKVDFYSGKQKKRQPH